MNSDSSVLVYNQSLLILLNQFPGITCMFFELRKFLVIFLALLQLVAPLVHAHAGEKSRPSSKTGLGNLHIPGLEALSVEQESLILNAASHPYIAEGVIIAVDTGIKQNQAKLINDAGTIYFLPSQTVAIKSSFSLFEKNFSPTLPAFAGRFLVSSHIPRAPPLSAQ
jgi:hypothetical protein